MKVIDHEPYAFYLLEQDGRFYLDAYCSHSFFDYSVLIALTEEETREFFAQGRTFVARLAYSIHYSAPAALGSRSPYKSRNLSIGDTPEAQKAHAAIMQWRAEQGL